MSSTRSARERLQAILDSFPLFIGIVDGEGRVLMVNRVPPEAMGVEPEEVLGKVATELEAWSHLPETREAWESHLARALAGETVRFDAKVKLADGHAILDMVMSPLPADEGQEVIAAGADVTERRAIEEELRRSEASLARAQRMARMGSWEQQLPDGRTRLSAEMRRLLSLGESDAVDAEVLLSRVHPDDRQRVSAHRTRAREQGEPYEIEYRLEVGSGSRHVRERAEVEADDDGAPGCLRVTVQDITSFKEAQLKVEQSLAEKEVLLQEIHHRVKNNLQVVSSLLALQAMSATEEALSRPLVESQRRVQAMAQIHELMYQSADLTRIDFEEYVKRLRTAVDHADSVAIVVDVSTPPLTIDVAVPCGLITSELVTNAYLHAFPDGREGTITVRLDVDGDDWVLSVEDDGIGVDEPIREGTEADGLGLRLVRALAHQLHGELHIRSGERTVFEVRFAAPIG